MPRGVAIPEIRQQLFAVTERLIVRDGPGKLSGRAVTAEAGVATGLLYAHFTDLDEFLAQYAVDRAFVISARAATLPDRAGTGGVVANLCEAVSAVPPVTVMASTRLLVARPDLIDRVRAVLGDSTAGLEAVESAAAAYLFAEQRLGRVAATADPELLAQAFVGVVHHIALTATAESDVPGRIRRTVTAMSDGFTVAAPRH
ncbi:TetR family transcriptional regulator [Nocardia transvalensis]|uniref:TetR family transcriptional regulator n=1 Tax=Nocardia transvalensis TaxID=37333 RepID=UPI00189625F1|nr:TetR/AcrR family transcriptional regulator [Nocardia transvalensis]MBF6332835.1 TetR/AcrR family transcriptional regulator [Nocardia transvalensis]